VLRSGPGVCGGPPRRSVGLRRTAPRRAPPPCAQECAAPASDRRPQTAPAHAGGGARAGRVSPGTRPGQARRRTGRQGPTAGARAPAGAGGGPMQGRPARPTAGGGHAPGPAAASRAGGRPGGQAGWRPRRRGRGRRTMASSVVRGREWCEAAPRGSPQPGPWRTSVCTGWGWGGVGSIEGRVEAQPWDHPRAWQPLAFVKECQPRHTAVCHTDDLPFRPQGPRSRSICQARAVKGGGRRPRGAEQRAEGHSPVRQGKAQTRSAPARGTSRIHASQRRPLPWTPWAWEDRPGARERPWAWS
jgi:hypothetical protein